MSNNYNFEIRKKTDWPEKLGYGLLIILLAIYPVYSNLISGYADDQYTRHLKYLDHSSDFFNPWQYRVFAPFLIEGLAAIFRPVFNNPAGEQILYFNIFKGVRFVQHLLIFGVAWNYYRYFNSNRLLIFFTFLVLAASMGSATLVSDFSFNNYYEIIFYLTAGLIIFSGRDIRWFLPLTLLAALNRETSLLLPFLLFIDYKKLLSPETRKKYWAVFLSSLLVFTLVFVGVRFYYGYQPPAPIGMETGWSMLRFNLTDPQTIIELMATLSILPIFCLLNIRKVEIRLQILFWLVVPAWFAIHFWLVWARETRLFLVPLALVFIPVCLNLLQKNISKTENSASPLKRAARIK